MHWLLFSHVRIIARSIASDHPFLRFSADFSPYTVSSSNAAQISPCYSYGYLSAKWIVGLSDRGVTPYFVHRLRYAFFSSNKVWPHSLYMVWGTLMFLGPSSHSLKTNCSFSLVVTHNRQNTVSISYMKDLLVDRSLDELRGCPSNLSLFRSVISLWRALFSLSSCASGLI